MLKIPVDAEIASEFRYNHPIILPDTLFIIISQSGETADTIAAMKEARKFGGVVLAITNVVGSTVAREADKVIYTMAGLEIAVASTKAYTAQLMVLYAFTAIMAQCRGVITEEQASEFFEKLEKYLTTLRRCWNVPAKCGNVQKRCTAEEASFSLAEDLTIRLQWRDRSSSRRYHIFTLRRMRPESLNTAQ